MSKDRARIFEICGEDNRDGSHAGFVKRMEWLPLEDGLSAIKDEIQRSGCEYFEIRIYDNHAAALRAYNHAKKRDENTLLDRVVDYINQKRLIRLWEKNGALAEMLKQQGRFDRNDFLNYINGKDIDSVAVQKNFNKALKAALKG